MAKKDTVLSILQQIRDVLVTNSTLNKMIEAVKSKDGRFVRNPDGTVTDKQFNLIWYPTLATKKTWAEAKEECEKMACRLPTRKELESLLDLSKYDPAIDKKIFPDTKTDDYYWTSDTCAWGSDSAWIVDFYYGRVYYYNKDGSYYVRPVRSSQ